MFLPQVMNTLKNPMHRHQLYWRCLQSIRSHSKIFCYPDNKKTKKNLYIIAANTRLTHSSNDEQKGFHSQNDKRQRYEQSKIINANLHENSISQLHQIYSTVNREFGKQHISFIYSEDTTTHPRKQICTINVSWPEKMSFSEAASSKKAAGLHAGRKCLMWLNQTGNVKNLIPELYTRTEIQSLLLNHFKIDLDSKFNNEIKFMLETYYHEIEPIITESSSMVIDGIDLEAKQTPFMNSSEDHEFRNRRLYSELEDRKDSEKNLPIQQYKSHILNTIENNQVVIIKGDTGCGKSTQIPQYIMDLYTEKLESHKCNILISQPRRVSAVSLAKRVASERRERLGHVVGYHIRLESVIPQSSGSILFCTTGIALRRLQRNAILENLSHIIIDEAHERTVEIDVLLGIVKQLLNDKPSLKLIIMSATINVDILQKYFSCDVIEIPGQIYPVKTHFLEDIKIFKQHNLSKMLKESETPLDDTAELIRWIIENKPLGGILCFLPGWSEIQILRKTLQYLQNYNVHIIPFHSKLTNLEQQEVFKTLPPGSQKIILATDIAENSITIPDVKYVVDTVRKRNLIWDERTSIYNICTHWVTRANINQRKGRAGRVSPGESYHLITEDMYHQLPSFPEPEIRRISLNELIVTSKRFGNENVRDFFSKMIEQPKKRSVSNAIETLMKLNILDENENLTPLGIRIVYFSMDVRYSKALILSCIFQCLSPMLSLITMLSTTTEMNTTSLMSKSVRKDIKHTFHSTSDHIALIRYFRNSVSDQQNSTKFHNNANKNDNSRKLWNIYNLHINDLINSKILLSADDCEHLNTNAKHSELLRAILFSASNQLLNVKPFGFKRGIFTKTINTIVSEKNTQVAISPDSVNSKRKNWPSPFLTYFHQVGQDGRKSSISDTSLLSPLSVVLFSQNEITCDWVK
nr:ATP-dependent RNA helicase DHX30-like isoform X1 [Nomia melanderi]